ncbi:FIST signal transduction protein, partial [candidate division KSB1 bacterium]
MLNFYSGHSSAVNSSRAIKECLEQVNEKTDGNISLVIINTTLGHNITQLLAGAQEMCPKAEIVGCTGSGVVETGWVSEAMRAVSVMAISGEEFSVTSKTELNSENSDIISQECAKELMAKRSDINMILVFGPGLDVNGNGIISGIESIFGKNVPIFGALAGFGGKEPRTPIFHGEEILDNSIVMVGFADPDLKLIQGAHHGLLPQDDYKFTVTKTQGVRVDELDGKPAWPYILNSLGLPTETIPIEMIAISGIGYSLDKDDQIEYDNSHILRAPLTLSEDGKSFYMQADVPENTVFVSCQRNEGHIFNGLDRLTERLNKSLEGYTPVAVFHADCMARGRMSNNEVKKDEIIAKMQQPFMKDKNLPWLGVY